MATITNEMKVKFTELRAGKHRMRAEFTNEKGEKTHSQRFGLRGGETYVDHKDKGKMRNYLARHGAPGANENWEDKYSAGALSRWVLWSEPDLQKGKERFAKRFNLKIVR